MKPFRFGVQLSNAPSGREWRDLARRIESLGYSSLLLPDHLGDQLSPLIALTVAAEATTSLRVGTLVLDNDFRHLLVSPRRRPPSTFSRRAVSSSASAPAGC